MRYSLPIYTLTWAMLWLACYAFDKAFHRGQTWD